MGEKPKKIERLSKFIAYAELSPIRTLHEKQNQIIEYVTDSAIRIYRQNGIDLKLPKVDEMERDDDYIAMLFAHDQHELRIDLHPDKIVLIKWNFSAELLGSTARLWSELIGAVKLSFSDEKTFAGPIKLENKITDFFHRFSSTVRLGCPEKNSELLLQRLFRNLNESPFGKLGLKEIGREVYRIDVKLSFGYETDKPSARNLWVTLEAPGNEDNTQLWLEFDVKPLPTERQDTSNARKTPSENLYSQFIDIDNSIRLFEKIFVQQFYASMFEGIQEITFVD